MSTSGHWGSSIDPLILDMRDELENITPPQKEGKVWTEILDSEPVCAPENGKTLKFKIGDKVIYTDNAGKKQQDVIDHLYTRAGMLYFRGYRYHLKNADCLVRELSLQFKIDECQ